MNWGRPLWLWIAAGFVAGFGFVALVPPPSALGWAGLISSSVVLLVASAGLAFRLGQATREIK